MEIGIYAYAFLPGLLDESSSLLDRWIRLLADGDGRSLEMQDLNRHFCLATNANRLFESCQEPPILSTDMRQVNFPIACGDLS